MKALTKTLLGGAAAAMVAGVAMAPSANAACQWTGTNWNCDTPQQVAGPPYYVPAPTWGFNPRDYQVPYNQVPNNGPQR